MDGDIEDPRDHSHQTHRKNQSETNVEKESYLQRWVYLALALVLVFSLTVASNKFRRRLVADPPARSRKLSNWKATETETFIDLLIYDCGHIYNGEKYEYPKTTSAIWGRVRTYHGITANNNKKYQVFKGGHHLAQRRKRKEFEEKKWKACKDFDKKMKKEFLKFAKGRYSHVETKEELEELLIRLVLEYSYVGKTFSFPDDETKKDAETFFAELYDEETRLAVLDDFRQGKLIPFGAIHSLLRIVQNTGSPQVLVTDKGEFLKLVEYKGPK